jgi:hypothetical protein
LFFQFHYQLLHEVEVDIDRFSLAAKGLSKGALIDDITEEGRLIPSLKRQRRSFCIPGKFVGGDSSARIFG